MHLHWRCALYLVFVSHLSHAIGAPETFDEELTLRPLRDGKLAARFSFTTLLQGVAPRDPSTLDRDDTCTCSTSVLRVHAHTVHAAQHYTLFPLALGQILREYAVTELHLSLNAGRWDYDRWGYPDETGVGTGGELWAWMGDGAPIS